MRLDVCFEQSFMAHLPTEKDDPDGIRRIPLTIDGQSHVMFVDSEGRGIIAPISENHPEHIVLQQLKYRDAWAV